MNDNQIAKHKTELKPDKVEYRISNGKESEKKYPSDMIQITRAKTNMKNPIVPDMILLSGFHCSRTANPVLIRY